MQLVQKGFHRAGVGKFVPALGIGAQLSRRLRAAQHQQAQQGAGLAGHAKDALKVVLPAHGTLTAHFHHEGALAQAVQRAEDLGLTEAHHRVAAGLLVAAAGQTVECHGVAVRHGTGFFHERGKHACFGRGQRVFVEVNGHGRDNRGAMKNIVILISGGGSNMAAIVKTAQQENWQQRYGARVAAVISNKADAKGLVFAKEHGIATEVLDHKQFDSREAFDAQLAEVIDRYEPALVVLAGFMRILTSGFVQHYAGRMVNIHPSLLPAFTGLHTHQRAIEAGCKFAGCTVHEVTAELDVGPILDQAVVPVLPDDTADTLAARVLTQEHIIYARAIAAWLEKH